MLKYIYLLAGALLLVWSSYIIAGLLPAYGSLSEYEMGNLWGNIVLLILGIVLLYAGIRKLKNER